MRNDEKYNARDLTVPVGNGSRMDKESLSMKSVHEVCRITGVTRKTLFYYDRIGLLAPTRRVGKQKSKMYGPVALERLKRILQYTDMGFRLNEVRIMLDGTAEEKRTVLESAKERIREEIRKDEELLEKLSACKE